MTRQQERDEDVKRTERALKLAFTVLLPRISADDWRPNLGFATPSMSRACVRSHEFFGQIADELGGWWLDLAKLSGEASFGEWRRLEREHLNDAATELGIAVGRLPPPLYEVVVRRASGMSWRRIIEGLPHRVYFSVLDDWKLAVRYLYTHHDDLIRRLV